MQNGFRVDGTTVFFREEDVNAALATAPSEFTVHARNLERSGADQRSQNKVCEGLGHHLI